MDKGPIRQRVWSELRRVARPDSRFHFEFSEFIPDFEGSSEALARLMECEDYQGARVVFITPDNCLEELRHLALTHQKVVLVPTYGILRGFVLLEPGTIAPELFRHAAALDGMEKIGRYVTLDQIYSLGRIDLLVTGVSVVNYQGIRFGKGHGYFDLEWALLFSVGVVDLDTPVFVVAHDCQVVSEQLESSEFDTVCDLIFTPERIIRVSNPQKPASGVIWDCLEPGMLEAIPPLQELKQMEKMLAEVGD